MMIKNCSFAAVCNGEMIGFANGSWVLDEGELLNIAVLENTDVRDWLKFSLKHLRIFYRKEYYRNLFGSQGEKSVCTVFL